MGNEPMDWLAFLSDLEAKRNALDATIASLRNALTLGALGQVGEIPPPSSGLTPSVFGPSTFVSSVTGGEVPAGAFLGKSIPDATKLYLEIVKKKQTSADIASALRKGGMETNSKNFPQMVHSVLDRASKANTGIVKLDRSHWGLASWYPASLRTTGAFQGRGASRKKSWKGKGAAKASPQRALKAAPSDVPVKGKANERAEAYLRSQPLAEHSLESVGHHLGMGIKGARLILGKLVKAGKIRMSAPGMYTVTPFRPSAAKMTEAEAS